MTVLFYIVTLITIVSASDQKLKRDYVNSYPPHDTPSQSSSGIGYSLYPQSDGYDPPSQIPSYVMKNVYSAPDYFKDHSDVYHAASPYHGPSSLTLPFDVAAFFKFYAIKLLATIGGLIFAFPIFLIILGLFSPLITLLKIASLKDMFMTPFKKKKDDARSLKSKIYDLAQFVQKSIEKYFDMYEAREENSTTFLPPKLTTIKIQQGIKKRK